MIATVKNAVPQPLKRVMTGAYRTILRDGIWRPAKRLRDNTHTELAARLRVRQEAPLLHAARQQHAADYAQLNEPLVTVTIATYNRAELLVERALKSALAQTHHNLEVIVVGDHCTDDTAQRIAALGDARVRFHNLPQRGNYPQDPKKRWMVAGTPPINYALQHANGLWIAHLDDDDIWEPDHISTMLRFAHERDAELVYSHMNREYAPDDWRLLGDPPSQRFWGLYRFPRIPHSSAVFRQYLRLFRFDIESWKVGAAVDHHVWVRMYRSGVRFAHLPQVTVQAPLRPAATSSDHLAQDRA